MNVWRLLEKELSVIRILHVLQETKPKFIDSQNIYFNFHYKLVCVKAVHLQWNLFDHGKWAFKTNKIFALDQSLPSFQGETNMFSASLSIASFDKKKWAWFVTSKEYVVILTP